MTDLAANVSEAGTNVGKRRFRGSFRRPSGLMTFMSNIALRALVGVTAAVTVTILIFLATFANRSFTTLTIVIAGCFIGLIVLFGEHLRSRAFERLQLGDNRRVTYEISTTGIFIDGVRIDSSGIEGSREPSKIYVNIIKPTLDFLASIIMLLLLSPLLVVIAILIKFDSPGPIFSRSLRIGKDGRVFAAFKFRTMYTGVEERLDALASEADWQLSQKIRNDPRVTRVGRVLRSTSWDELPLLLNVVAGDMSIVGPSPRTAKEVGEGGLYAGVKPGLTGPWQVAARRNADAIAREKLDLAYIENQSILLDLKLLGRTLIVAFRNR